MKKKAGGGLFVFALLLIAGLCGQGVWAHDECHAPETPCAHATCETGEICLNHIHSCPNSSVAASAPCPQYTCLSAQQCPGACTEEYAPLCGDDGVTYDNPCYLRRAECEDRRVIGVVAQEECQVPTAEPTQGQSPGCAAATCLEGYTCLEDPKQCVTSPCDQFLCVQCPDVCTEEYAPQCGDDGVTYANPCYLRRAECEKGRTIHATQGECQAEPTQGQSPGCAATTCLEGYTCIEDPKDCDCEQAQCVQCPDVCTLEYAPLCGDDGVTYANPCYLRRAECDKGQTIHATQGECQGPTESPTTAPTPEPTIPSCVPPVPTLPNGQSACAAATCLEGYTCLDDPKECTTTPCQQFVCVGPDTCYNAFCVSDYHPVCGSDGVTYTNQCYLHMAMCFEQYKVIKPVYNGPCEDLAGLPICGAGEPTGLPQDACFGNPCAQGEVCLNNGTGFVCIPPDDCPQICPAIYAPVCGTDGRTYSSECTLNSTACIEKRLISVAHTGECQGDPCDSSPCGQDEICLNSQKTCAPTDPCPQYQCQPKVCPELCPAIYSPLCGTDGVTYSNECELLKARCLLRKVIEIEHQGACEGIPQNFCQGNNCTKDELCVADPKECFTTPCPQYQCVPVPFQCSQACKTIYEPVCASDGYSYSSATLTKIVNCFNGWNLTVVSRGECTEPEFLYSCVDSNCTSSELCLEEPKACVTTPCDQFSCTPHSECPALACNEDYEPVCGSDGVSYNNECFLKRTTCFGKKRIISVAHQGLCNGDEPTIPQGECVLPCPLGEHCELQENRPTCVRDVAVCNMLCIRGSHCEIQDGRPNCVPDEPQAPSPVCNLLCTIGHHCEIQDGQPTCVPDVVACNLLCTIGHHCEIQDGHPACVPDVVACNLLCIIGRHCEIQNGEPTCVPNASPPPNQPSGELPTAPSSTPIAPTVSSPPQGTNAPGEEPTNPSSEAPSEAPSKAPSNPEYPPSLPPITPSPPSGQEEPTEPQEGTSAPPSACSSSPCPSDTTCLEDPKQCVSEPCQQYVCIAQGFCPIEACLDVYQPVCGSDGQTYSNECILNQTVCDQRRFIFVDRMGECEGPRFWLEITSAAGEYARIEVTLSMTVSELKILIEDELHIPVKEQQLFANGETLEDDKTLEEEGIDDQTLVIAVKSEIGKKK